MSETPRQLGRYELIRRIATGGMGEIYLARVRGTAGFEKSVIIKTILPHLAEEEEFVEKFLDEGRIVVNLTHGNIVPVFDMDEVDGEYFIAMDYVPGRDVRDMLARLGNKGETMPADLAAYIVSEVCEGLGYAHRKTDEQGEPLDIVHRDVSPSNVLVSTDGEVKIIDFGIARAADRRAKTVSGRIQGKCCYMSPEQASGEDLDCRSDIFSTGVVLYEMVTNVRPFEGKSDLKSLDLVRECDYPPPSELAESVPEQLDAIIERAMTPDPEERYQSIDQMQVDLMEYLVSRGQTITSQDVASFLGELYPEGPEREDFQDVTEADEEPPSDMNLDDALAWELDQMAEESEPARQVDPLEVTMPEESSAGSGRTETLTPEVGPKSEEPEEFEESKESGESEESKESGESGESQTTEEQPAGRGVDAESAGERRRVGLMVGVGLLALLGLAAGAFLWGEQKGTVEIETEPEGARISVDGSQLADRRTPATVRLDPGPHRLTLSLADHEDRRFRISLPSGGRERISADLTPRTREADPEPRSFQLRTRPRGATVLVNQERRGPAPRTIAVAPGETKFVEARREGCANGQMPVFYGRASDTVTIRLDCESGADAGGEAAAAKPTDEPEPEPTVERSEPRAVAIRFVSDPSGARLQVDGELVGTTPVEETYRPGRRLAVRLQKEGYETLERSVRAGEVDDGVFRGELTEQPKGCLDFFAVHPQFNELAIDGEWLDGRRQKLQGHPLAVGSHTIRVRNPDADKDETFRFEVEPGDDCTSLTVWDPDEPGE
jgi:serine/threonine protein kinase